MDVITNKYFITDLYRDIIPTPEPGEIVDLPKSNYNQYNIFVLRTRLQVLTRKKWSRNDIRFIFESVEYKLDSKMYIQIRPMVHNKKLILDLARLKQYQKMIIKATSTPLDYAVLFSNKNYSVGDHIINGDWIMSVLPLIPLKNKIKYKFGFYGLEVNIYGSLNTGYPSYPSDDYDEMIDLNPYIRKYRKIQEYFEDIFIRWFKAGVCVDPPPKIILDWNMTQIKDRLYKLNWIDRRITDASGGRWNFINSRIMGTKGVLLPASGNLVVRHRIAKMFYSKEYIPSFYGNNIMIDAKNLTQANDILYHISHVSRETGKIAVFRVTAPKHMETYIKIANDLDITDIVFYLTDGINGKELRFSAELSDLDLDPQIIIHNIQSRMRS